MLRCSSLPLAAPGLDCTLVDCVRTGVWMRYMGGYNCDKSMLQPWVMQCTVHFVHVQTRELQLETGGTMREESGCILSSLPPSLAARRKRGSPLCDSILRLPNPHAAPAAGPDRPAGCSLGRLVPPQGQGPLVLPRPRWASLQDCEHPPRPSKASARLLAAGLRSWGSSL